MVGEANRGQRADGTTYPKRTDVRHAQLRPFSVGGKGLVGGPFYTRGQVAVPFVLDKLIPSPGETCPLCPCGCFSLAKSATLRHVQDLLANHRQPLAQPGEISCSTG
jgi:hypothetical protein